MGPLALLNHAINFAAPALWLALLVPLLSRIFMRKRPLAQAFPSQVAIHLIVCLLALAIGLVLYFAYGMKHSKLKDHTIEV